MDKKNDEFNEQLPEVTDNDLRVTVAEQLGLSSDDEEHAEIIDRAVAREKENRERLSKAIGQKIKLRDELNGFKSTSSDDTEPKGKTKDSATGTVEAKIRAELNEEYLDEVDYSDEIKSAIREWSSFKNVSAKKATLAPHIKIQIDAWEQEKRNLEASKNGSGTGMTGSETGVMPSKFTDPKFMSTEEGRKAYSKWVSSQK